MASGSAPLIAAWWFALDLPPERREAMASVMSAGERERAARFHRERDRHRWAVSRGALRRIIGAALDADPATIEFGAGPQGKPSLAGAHAGALEFNLSHSAGIALVAVATAGPLGADVEEVAPMDDLRLVAERHFARDEQEALLALPDAERLRAFHRIWTRKEAYIKAIGAGLGHPLDRFAVTLAADDCRLLHLDGDTAAARWWTLAHLEPGTDGRFVGAVAAPFEGAAVELREWKPT